MYTLSITLDTAVYLADDLMNRKHDLFVFIGVPSPSPTQKRTHPDTDAARLNRDKPPQIVKWKQNDKKNDNEMQRKEKYYFMLTNYWFP